MDEKREDHQRARRQNRWRRAAPFKWGVGAAEQRKREERSAADANPPPPRVIPQAPSRRSWKPSLDTQPVMAKRRTESVSARPPTGGSTLTLCSAGVAQNVFCPCCGPARPCCRAGLPRRRTLVAHDTHRRHWPGGQFLSGMERGTAGNGTRPAACCWTRRRRLSMHGPDVYSSPHEPHQSWSTRNAINPCEAD